MKKLDQTQRHIIDVQIPFTEEQLKMFIGYMNGWQDQPEIVEGYYENIIDEGRVDLNPSSHLGEGASIARCFSFGFMALMKEWFKVDVDPEICWWHPCSIQIPTKINSMDITWEDVEIISNERVMYSALVANKSGEVEGVVHADQFDSCSGNTDQLDKYAHDDYSDDDDLPF